MCYFLDPLPLNDMGHTFPYFHSFDPFVPRNASQIALLVVQASPASKLCCVVMSTSSPHNIGGNNPRPSHVKKIMIITAIRRMIGSQRQDPS